MKNLTHRLGRRLSAPQSSARRGRCQHLVEALEPREMFTADLAGNTLAAARVISLPTTPAVFTDFVGAADTNDYYRFTTTAPRIVTLNLGNLTADADLQLLNSTGGLLAASTVRGTGAESITASLAAGTYYIRAYQFSGDTNYTLTASAVPLDNAGNTAATAKVLGTLSPTKQTVTDWVGNADTDDFYSVTIGSAGVFGLQLSGLTADADVQVLDTTGAVVAASQVRGLGNETISTTLAAGTYSVRVFQYSGDTAYTLDLWNAPPDNAGNTMATARVVNNLGTTAQVFSDWVGTADVNDFYRVTLASQSVLVVNMSGLTADADIQFLSATGTSLAVLGTRGTAAEAMSPTVAAGTYYVRVFQYSGDTTYNLSMLAMPPDNAGNTTAAARNVGNLTSAQSFQDWIGTPDANDYYKFTVATTSNFVLTLSGLSADLNARLLNSTGVVLATSLNTGTAGESITKSLAAGTYYINITQFSGESAYNLTVSALPPDNAGNTTAAARSITGLTPARQTLTDWVGAADTNDYYTFTLNSAGSFGLALYGMVADADVQLLNSTGTVIAASQVRGVGNEAIAAPLAAGTYFVRVFQYSGDTAYNLDLWCAPPDNAGNNGTLAQVVPGLTTTAQIFQDWVGTADTNDYYRFTLTAQSAVSLGLSGLNADADLALLNSTGATVALSQVRGTGAEAINTTVAAGTYYIRVYQFSGDTFYNLSALATPPDFAGNTTAAARNIGTLTSAQSFQDWIGNADPSDYYKFTTATSSNFALALSGLSADLNVRLLDSAGNMIGNSQNSGTAAESINTTLAAGTYYVCVYRYSGESTYNLTLSALPPDNAGNTTLAARDLGTLSTTQNLQDWIGSADTNDFYSFTIGTRSNFALALSGLTADADVQLLSSTGAVMMTSAKRGLLAESLSAVLDMGTYFARVYQYSGDTTYTLGLTATAVPAPAPTPGGVSITQQQLGTTKELDITGTSGDDSIVVTQSGTTLTITANGVATNVTGAFGDLVIHGGAGNDTLTVNSSVTISCRLYGDAGNDTMLNQTTGQATIVAIGGGTDTLTGNALNTAFWADNADTVNASAAETSHGNVHRVAAFYQPFSTNPTNAQYIPLELLGQNLTDPTDTGTSYRLTTSSFWGTGPSMTDINQGGVGDCYYLATLAGMASQSPATLVQLGVDLGDGTYAVEYKRNGVNTFVRVDGDLKAGGWNGLAYNHPGASGASWGCIFEKAYAFFRTGANTYNSINSGWMGSVMSDFGIANTNYAANTPAASLFATISQALAGGHAVTAGTLSAPASAPVVGGHAYTIIGASCDASGNITYTLRNPWGVDGVTNNSNMNDGIITITAAQLANNFSAVALAV